MTLKAIKTHIYLTIILLIIVLYLLTTGCNLSEKKSRKEIKKLDNLQEIEEIIEVKQLDTVFEPFIDKVKAYKIVYKSDDKKVVGYISAPKDYETKKYPILIYNRGGNQILGANDQSMINGLLPYYSSNGYITLASEYKGAAGGTGTFKFGGDNVNDVIKLIDIAEKFSFADTKNIFMEGSSSGGEMTYMVCKEDNRIRAAVSGAGVSDLVQVYNEREDRMKDVYKLYIGGSPEELPEEYKIRSAINWADKIKVPLLLKHGTEDDRVSVNQSKKLAEELEKYGKEYKLVIYEGAGHELKGTNNFLESIKWFEKYRIKE